MFALAGTVTLMSATLAATLSPWFLLLTGFVGFNQLLYVTVRASADPGRVGVRGSSPLNSTRSDLDF
jgi:hypothetical protein